MKKNIVYSFVYRTYFKLWKIFLNDPNSASGKLQHSPLKLRDPVVFSILIMWIYFPQISE